jgi:transcriptional regulator with XRE-family HTH domain
MTGPGTTRRELGRRLAGARKAAGYTQQQLAAAAGYSRSTVSNAEIGHPDVARLFWARCEKVLKSGRMLALAFDQIRAAERREAAGLPDVVPDAALGAFRQARRKITSGGMAEALAGYRDLGWPAQPGDAGMELVTVDVLDVLELPRAAGMLAVSLWLYSRGRADEILRVPALPHPARSLAVIAARGAVLFPHRTGELPVDGARGRPRPLRSRRWRGRRGHPLACRRGPDPGAAVAAARRRAGLLGAPAVPPSAAGTAGRAAGSARHRHRDRRSRPGWPYPAWRYPRHPRTPAAGFPARPVAARQSASHPAGHSPASAPPAQAFPGAGHHRESRAIIDPHSGHAIYCHAPGRVPSRGLLPGRG